MAQGAIQTLLQGEVSKVKCDTHPDKEVEALEGFIKPGPCKPVSTAFQGHKASEREREHARERERFRNATKELCGI